MTAREGPKLTIEASCNGCSYVREKSYRVQGDSGFDVKCVHPQARQLGHVGDSTWRTPDWCPLLEAARQELVTELVREKRE